VANNYGVAEITQTEGVMEVEQRGGVDLDKLRDQLTEIRDAISPMVTEVPADGALGLESVAISLTVSREGRILFIASGSVSASITLTWARPRGSSNSL
jgi:hypothetical protein